MSTPVSCEKFNEPFEACFEQAGQAIRKGALSEALAIYQVAIDHLSHLPPHLQVAAFLGKARITRWLRQWETSEQTYRKALDLVADNSEAYLGLALIALERKDFASSKALLDNAEKLGNTSDELRLAKQWYRAAWRYQLTLGAQYVDNSASRYTLPLLSLAMQVNDQIRLDAGFRAREVIRKFDSSSITDVLVKSNIYDLSLAWRPSERAFWLLQMDQSDQKSGSRDRNLRLQYEGKKLFLQASEQEAGQWAQWNVRFRSGEVVQQSVTELIATVNLPLSYDWTLLGGITHVREGQIFATQFAEVGLRRRLGKYFSSASPSNLALRVRSAQTDYGSTTSYRHQAVLLDATVPVLNEAVLGLNLGVDSLWDKRQAELSWRYIPKNPLSPRAELRYAWIQESPAGSVTQRTIAKAELNVPLSEAADLRFLLNKERSQGLGNILSAQMLLNWRWK